MKPGCSDRNHSTNGVSVSVENFFENYPTESPVKRRFITGFGGTASNAPTSDAELQANPRALNARLHATHQALWRRKTEARVLFHGQNRRIGLNPVKEIAETDILIGSMLIIVVIGDGQDDDGRVGVFLEHIKRQRAAEARR